MRVAITGASGLVGANLADALCRRGDSVVATRRGTSKVAHLEHLPIEWVTADLGDPDALARAFAGADLVFHVAAMVSVRKAPTPDLIATNVGGTRNVVAAVRKAGVPRLVHCSSVVAVGVSEDGRPCTEDADWNLVQHGIVDGYAITKRGAEDVVRSAVREGLDAVIVNPTYMFGPYDARPSSGTMILEIAKKKLPALSPGASNFVDVRDVVDGMLRAAEKGRPGERYILGGENLPYAEMFRRIGAIVGVSPPGYYAPRWIGSMLGWMGDLQEKLSDGEPFINSTVVRYGYCSTFQFSSEKAERELGYTHRDPDEGVRAAVAWFRERGMM